MMSRLLLSALLLSCCLLSCLQEEPPAITVNIFDETGPDVFTLIDFTGNPIGPTRTDVIVNISSVYDLTTAVQKDIIDGIEATGSRFGAILVAADANSFTDESVRIGQEMCYSVSFTLVSGGRSRASEICITP